MDSELKTPYKISLDFYIRKIITVNAKQLDSDSRVINITCTENGKKFFVDSSTTSAFVRYKKSDGHSVLNQVDILSDGTVNLELSQQMLAVEGRQLVDIMLINKSELEVYTSSISVEDDDNGNVTVIEKQTANVSDLSVEEILEAITENGISVLSTMSFYINTEGVAIDGSQIESSYEYNALIDGLGKMVAVDRRLVQVEENAEYAIQKCNTVTNGANTATNTANNATKNANDATQRANTAAKNAEDVTSEAKTATQACQEIIDKVASIEDFDKIDEILNYKIEVTQEEYDALSDEEKNNGKIYFITDVSEGGTASEVFYDNTESGLVSANVQNAIDEVATDFTNYKSNISNTNLFINGNFQIWSNGTEFLDVAASELTSVADRWSVFYNYNNPGMLNITKTEDGLCVAHGSARPIIVTQVLDEETFNSLKGKTLTLSYGIKNTEYTEYTRQIEVSDSDTDRFIFALENSYIELFDGDTLKWAKLEVGTVHTPCVPDSKDAIICKLEKQNKEAPVVLCSGNNTSGNYTEHEINDISEYKMLFLCAMVVGTSRIICSTVIFPNLIAFNSTTIYDVKYQGVSGDYVVHCYFTDNTKCHVSTDDLSICSYTLIGVK